MAEPDEEQDEQKPKKSSILMMAAIFLLITAIAAGAGFGVGMFLKPQTEMAAADEHADEGAESHEDGKEGEHAEGEEGSQIPLSGRAKPLAPILTNLAAPEDVWVRLEVAVVAEEDTPDALLEDIHQDLLAYMRTTKLHQVDGPSGFLNLRAELDDRAAIRSSGKVSRVLVRTIIFE